MNKIITTGVGIVAVLALVVSFSASSKTPSVGAVGASGVQGERGLKGDTGPIGPRGAQGVPGRDGSSLSVGSLSGPDIASPYISVGGVQEWRGYQTFTGQTGNVAVGNAAAGMSTSTYCALPWPQATSTLLNASFNVTTPTSTAATVYIALSTTTVTANVTSGGLATSTVLETYNLASAATGAFLFSTSTNVAATNSAASTTNRGATNIWLVFAAKGFNNIPAAADASKFIGSCSARWQVL